MTVHTAVSRWAAESPDRTALVGALVGAPVAAPVAALVGAPAVTYRELDARTRGFARQLATLGLGVGDRVALWMNKGHAYPISILGALRAGCAYVPLDAGQPTSRVETILRDANPAIVVAGLAQLKTLQAALPASVKRVIVTGDAGDVAAAQDLALVADRDLVGFSRVVSDDQPFEDPDVSLDALGAILYTSGSTGVPKGVQLSHRNLANFIGWSIREMQLGPDDVFSQHASFNFDLSTFDLFAGLGAGGAVWIIDEAAAHNPLALATGIREHGVTVWYSVPSILGLLVTSGAFDAELAAQLKVVNFAGEVFPIGRLRELQALLRPDCRLYNLYGPTETNVCTWYRVEQIADDRTTPVPIGRPIDRTRVVVVDDAGTPVSGQDEIGELVVEGDCVTPGYWHREGDRNTANHLDGRHATGDLVTYEGDDLVYRGRKDRMIKLRGFRVELGEIEAAMATHPAIDDVAVVPLPVGNDTRLVVFYTPVEGQTLSVLAMKQHAQSRVPRYMIPHAVTPLDALPKNANGKTDYLRLGEIARGNEPGGRT